MAKRAAFEMNELTGVIPIYFTTGATGVFVGIIALLSWYCRRFNVACV